MIGTPHKQRSREWVDTTKEAAEKLQNENRDGTYAVSTGEERRDNNHDISITAADRNHSPEARRSRRREEKSMWTTRAGFMQQ